MYALLPMYGYMQSMNFIHAFRHEVKVTVINFMSSESVHDRNGSSTNAIICNEGFYLDGICRPECGEWEEFSHSTVLAFDTVVVLQAVAYLIGAVVVLILSCIRYKNM